MSLLLYAIADERHPEPQGLSGVHGGPLQMVRASRLAAVVEDVEAAPPVELSALEGFAEVTRALAASDTILPARFGSMMPDAGAVVAMLERRADALGQRLARVRDAVEFGLRAVPVISAGAKEPAASQGAGTAYLMGRVAEHRREQQLLATITSAVADQTRDCAERADRRHGVAVACLVDRGATEPFLSAVQRLRERLAAEAQVSCTGPWAPFSFSAETQA